MTFTIKYKIESKPKKVKKVSDLLIGAGAVLFVVGNWIYTPPSTLPLELQVFALGEFIPKLFFDFNFLAIAVLIVGLILIPLKWRSGKIFLEIDRVTIEGSVVVGVLIDKLQNIDVFDANHGVKRTVHLTSDNDKVKLKFRNGVDFENFCASLFELAGEKENVKFKTWTN